MTFLLHPLDQYCLLPLLNNPSRIVIISSVAARMGLASQVCYGGGKAFLEHTYVSVYSCAPEEGGKKSKAIF